MAALGLLTAFGVAPGASGAKPRDALVAGAAVAAPGGGSAKPRRAERRCRSLARRRLARADRARVRARIRKKLRRCLRAARQRARRPAPEPGEDPGPGLGSPPSDPNPPPAPLGRFVGVTASDSADGFRLTLSRPAVAAGDVTVQLRNTDSGPHDLVIRPETGGTEVAHFAPLDPGGLYQQQVGLSRGRWYLLCSLDGHEAAGMHVTLRAE